MSKNQLENRLAYWFMTFAEGWDPVAADGDPVAAGWDPVAAGLNPVGAGLDPVGAGWDPVGAGWDPVGAGWDPVGVGLDPVGVGLDPVGAGLDPVAAGLDPVAAVRESGTVGRGLKVKGVTGGVELNDSKSSSFVNQSVIRFIALLAEIGRMVPLWEAGSGFVTGSWGDDIGDVGEGEGEGEGEEIKLGIREDVAWDGDREGEGPWYVTPEET
ncbi:MAG: hypothetical protein FWG40_09120 [Peptococcaceae bacterium]|nr:hypothetical protein [Peptococcaceae bacterium]